MTIARADAISAPAASDHPSNLLSDGNAEDGPGQHRDNDD